MVTATIAAAPNTARTNTGAHCHTFRHTRGASGIGAAPSWASARRSRSRSESYPHFRHHDRPATRIPAPHGHGEDCRATTGSSAGGTGHDSFFSGNGVSAAVGPAGEVSGFSAPPHQA